LVHGGRPRDRAARRDPSGGARVRHESRSARDSVPSGGASGRGGRRIPLGNRAQANAAQEGGGGALDPAPRLVAHLSAGAQDPARRARFLDSLQTSRLLLARRGIWGLRTLVLMGYYGRPRAAAAIGYRADPRGWEARR